MINQNFRNQGGESFLNEISQGQISKDMSLHSISTVRFAPQQNLRKIRTSFNSKRQAFHKMNSIRFKKLDSKLSSLNSKHYSYLLQIERLHMKAITTVMTQFIQSSFDVIQANNDANVSL